MKIFLKLLFLPFLIISILEVIMAAALGGMLGLERESIWNSITLFFIWSFAGFSAYQLAPEGAKLLLSHVVPAIYLGISIYLGIQFDDEIIEIMGESITQEFLVLPELARAFGALLGIWSAHQNEKDEQQRKEYEQ